MRLTKKQRAELHMKYAGRCAYCGCELGDRWHADHFEPVIGVVCGRGRNPTLRLWPAIFSGEIDVFPSERRNMGQEIGR